MSDQSERDTMKARAARAVRGAIAIAVAATCSVLAACSSGSGGTDVTIGSGQNQDPVTLDFPVFYVKRPVPTEEEQEDLVDDARALRRFQIAPTCHALPRPAPRPKTSPPARPKVSAIRALT